MTLALLHSIFPETAATESNTEQPEREAEAAENQTLADSVAREGYTAEAEAAPERDRMGLASADSVSSLLRTSRYFT